MGSILTWSVGLSLIGWALILGAVASQRVQDATARADKAEQLAQEADARTNKAIELWNDERADHARDLEAFKAQLEVLKEQALATVAQYRHAFDQLAALVRCAREEREADERDDDAPGDPPRRVM
jgi:hypothetical protein